MSEHLDEQALEALSTGRDDLVSEEALLHLDECADCAELVSLERRGARDASLALERMIPELDDLDAMIVQAMEKAPTTPPPSRRSLLVGAGVGAVAAISLALLALPGAGSIGGASAVGRQLITLGRALDRVVDSMMPGGWASVAVLGLILGLLLVVPMRLALGQKLRGASALTSALAVGLLAFVSLPSMARAYRVDGTWPEPQPLVTVDVENQPTSEALRQAAQSAGLGVVVRLPHDTPVTLHVRNAPIGEVIAALLGESDVVVTPGASLINVRVDDTPAPMALAIPAPPQVPVAPPVPDSAAPPIPPRRGWSIPGSWSPSPVPALPPGGVADRVTFGADVEIAAGEEVRDVVTMGGDAKIRGRAFGDVVTMGGDAEIEGEVIGNVTTMGGNITLGDAARIHGDLNAMGGEIAVADSSTVYGRVLSAADGSRTTIDLGERADDSSDGPLSSMVRWALFNVMLFLFGLLLMGSARRRFSNLRTELSDRPVRSAFGGFFGALAGGVLGFVLLLTLIGIPVSMVLAVLITVGVGVGWTTCAWWLGGVLPIAQLKDRPVAQLASGIGALFVVGLVPFVGKLLVIAAVLAGFGAVISTTFGEKVSAQKKPRHAATGPFRLGA